MRLRVWWLLAFVAPIALSASGPPGAPAGAGRMSPGVPSGDRAGCIEVSAGGVVPPGGSRLVRIPLRLRAGVCPPGRQILTAGGPEAG